MINDVIDRDVDASVGESHQYLLDPCAITRLTNNAIG